MRLTFMLDVIKILNVPVWSFQATGQSALLSPGLSSLELDSSTSMSLPSPASCSLDGTGSLSPPPGGDIASIPSLQVRVGVIKRRVSKQIDLGPALANF